jgi:hypothetical protein
MQRLSRSLSRFETQDIKTQPMNQPLFFFLKVDSAESCLEFERTAGRFLPNSWSNGC